MCCLTLSLQVNEREYGRWFWYKGCPDAGKRTRVRERCFGRFRLRDFSGQAKVVENLKVFVMAARMRKGRRWIMCMDLPGWRKTTLSNIIANELGVGFKVTSGPVLDKAGRSGRGIDLAGEERRAFIDEIHRLSPIVEEYLYSAMEDYRIDIVIDKGPSARSIQIDLAPFTLIGATTRSGLLTSVRCVPVSVSICTWIMIWRPWRRSCSVVLISWM